MPVPDRDRPLVLVVDDEPVGREVLEAILEDEGYALASARDGGEALARARELVPDLVLLDVMMPVLDGFEVLRQIRSDPELAQVPVVLVTALNDRESRIRGIEAGADDFLTKPIDRLELSARVRTVTRLDRFRRLQAERAKFEWAVEAADDGYLMLGASGEVLYANPRARLYLGLEGGEPAPEAFLALAQRQYRCEPLDAWAAWPDDPVPAPRYLVRPDSSVAAALWLHVESLRLPPRQEGARLLRLRDVSERMRARREVWAFHSAVSHKLRTPLAGMLPSLEFLASAGERLPSETVRTLAASAFRGAERLHGAIEDVLGYLEASRQPWTQEGFDLAGLPALVREAGGRLGLASVEVSGAQELGRARVALAGRALELVLAELIENACKFHPAHAPVVEVALARSGEAQVRLVVRDDGVALPPEHLARALSPYYQGERHHTGQAAGMGLGLPMVASIVWSAGGACRLANRTDRPGLEVELLLPLSR